VSNKSADDDLKTVPTHFSDTSNGYCGPRRSVIAAACAVASIGIIATGWWLSSAQRSDASTSATPITKLQGQPALTQGVDESATAIVIPDPTGSPPGLLDRFLPHLVTPSAASVARTAPPTGIVIRQTASVTEPVSQRARTANPDDQNTDSTMHLEAPPSQDAQAQADLASIGRTDQARLIAQSNRSHSSANEEFFRSSEEHVGYVAPTSTDELWATTTISCRLETLIDSALPGVVRARVVQPVYDSRSHNHVVIPTGTLVAGNYNTRVVGGQARLLVAWTRLYFPDGRKFAMGSQEGADAAGAAGFEGRVNAHTGQALRAGLLMTLFGVGTALLNPPSSILTTQSIGSQLSQAAGGELSQVGNRIADRQLQQGPTIRVAPPYEFQIVLLEDLPIGRYAK
jgi:type IV secretory pathway VirB10-like protein